MSGFDLTTPISFADLAGPLFALALIAVAALVFEPLLRGLLRAAILVVKPRQTNEQRRAGRTLLSMLTIDRLANEADASDPSFAAELRVLAARA